MSTIKKYDIPGINNIPSRYDPLVPILVEKSDLFFRWQILVGDRILESSALDNYMGIPANAVNFNNPQGPTIDFNLKTLLGPKNLHPGSYLLRLYANRLWRDQGNTKQVKFYIKTISPSKDELVLGVHDPILSIENRAQTTAYQSAVDQVLNPATGILSVDRPVLSLEDGSVVNVISHKIIGGNKYTTLDFAVKTSEPIPKNLKPGSLLKLEIAIIEPREFNFIIPQAPYVEDLNIMALPDFTTNFATSQGPLSSKYETWESLLGTNEGVKNELLNSMFSSSAATSAVLGIDYRKYDNFVHFSSAKERLDNFKYKIQLIEYYDSQSAVLSSSSSPTAEVNRIQFVTKKNNIISKFDSYENYLYTESSSYESGSYGVFNASTWPKSTSAKPHALFHSTSSEVTTWFTAQTAEALDYDIDNPYNLEKTIPAHVRLDPENTNYMMFVNMIGQNFDHVYNYVDHMDMIHDRQNELHLGLSKDLVWDVLKSLGWNGINGYNFDDLWTYKLGTDESGNYQATDSGSTQTFVNASSMPTEDITKEVWSRTLNSLPHLLSSKGTERSVRALVNTYGLPQTVLRIKEYGGTPKEMSTKQYIKYENSGYSLNFNGSQFVEAPWSMLEADNYSHMSTDKAPDLIELRFNATKPQSSILIHSSYSKWGIELEAHPSASNTSSAYYNHGRVWIGAQTQSTATHLEATSSGYYPLFDNDWWNIQFGISSADTFNFHLKKSADHSNGRITHEEKIAWDMGSSGYDIYNHSWDENSNVTTLTLGNHDPYASGAAGWKMASGSIVAAGTLPGFTGSMQELRYWAFSDNTILSDEAFDNHVLSPLSIEGNTYTSSYTDLVARWPLGSTGATASLTTALISSSHPNQNVSATPWTGSTGQTMTLSGSGYTGTAADWQYEEETFYTVVPEIIGTRAVSDKIRIDNSTFTGSFYIDSSVVSSSIELSAPDSPLLGVFFSPNDDIDLDISHAIGGAKFDDFVGNPRDAYRKTYKELRSISNFYWQKYQASPTFAAYLKVLKYFDSSLFLQLESLLPARANKQTGLLIKPNLLERPTIARVSESFANLTYEQTEAITFKPVFSTEHLEPYEAVFKTYMIYDRDTHASATPHFPNSFDDSLATGYGISNMASADVPVYDRTTTSKRYITQETNGTETSVAVQDFLPTAINNQRYGGSKYGTVNGSIGGIINLVNDPQVTGKGLFDSSTNIRCSIEVVETNPVELTTTQGPLTALGDIQIR